MSDIIEKLNDLRKVKFEEIEYRDKKGKLVTKLVKEGAIEHSTRVANELFSILIQNGRFIVEKGTYFYFVEEECKTYKVTESNSLLTNDFKRHLGMVYNVTDSDLNIKRVIERVLTKITYEAEEVQLHTISYYNQQKNILYIRKSDNEWFKITTRKIYIVPNGKDGVYAKGEAEDIDIKLDDLKDTEDYLVKKFLSRLWYEKGARDEYMLMIKFWMLTIFFKEIMPEKPILVISGDAGAGKTTILETLGNIIYGSNFVVSGTTKDERDFISQVSQRQYVAMDNVDEDMPTWFADKLAGIATGMGFSLRRLYKDVDSPISIIKPQTFIGITTRTPRFNRDDIADRSAVVMLSKRKNESHQRFKLDRNLIWLGLLNNLQRVLVNFKENEDASIPESSIRMSSFFDFCFKASRQEKWSHVHTVFHKMKKDQIDFAMIEKPIIDALIDIAERKPGRYSVNELLYVLNNDYDNDIKSNVHLGRLISDSKGLIKKTIFFDKIKSSGQSIYIIGKDIDIDNTDIVENTFYGD